MTNRRAVLDPVINATITKLNGEPQLAISTSRTKGTDEAPHAKQLLEDVSSEVRDTAEVLSAR